MCENQAMNSGSLNLWAKIAWRICQRWCWKTFLSYNLIFRLTCLIRIRIKRILNALLYPFSNNQYLFFLALKEKYVRKLLRRWCCLIKNKVIYSFYEESCIHSNQRDVGLWDYGRNTHERKGKETKDNPECLLASSKTKT